MALLRTTIISTASLVAVRGAGVAARALALLALAAVMPAEDFAGYALAFVFSELARCGTDFGLDPVILRRAEGLPEGEQRQMIRAALAIRAAHGSAAALLVLVALHLTVGLDLLTAAAGLQFFSQGMLQLSLNWRQANDSAHRIAPALAAFYTVIIVLAAASYQVPPLARLLLPLLLAGESLIGAGLLLSLGFPRLDDLQNGYRQLIPQGLPMAGIMLLAFVNTRSDALLVGELLEPTAAGRYLYLSRWADLAPMLATGIALPLIGKVGRPAFRKLRPLLLVLAVMLAAAPFILVEIGAMLNRAYAGDESLRMLLAITAVCRIGLAMTTLSLLAQWRDGLLARLALVTTAAVPALVWGLGSSFGADGIILGVLIAEVSNLLCQLAILLGGPAFWRRGVTIGTKHE